MEKYTVLTGLSLLGAGTTRFIVGFTHQTVCCSFLSVLVVLGSILHHSVSLLFRAQPAWGTTQFIVKFIGQTTGCSFLRVLGMLESTFRWSASLLFLDPFQDFDIPQFYS